jgi:ferredoxin
MSYTATIDEDACCAHGDCAEIAPEAFELADIARVVGTGPDALLLAAAEACPATAIILVDEATGDQLFP